MEVEVTEVMVLNRVVVDVFVVVVVVGESDSSSSGSNGGCLYFLLVKWSYFTEDGYMNSIS